MGHPHGARWLFRVACALTVLCVAEAAKLKSLGTTVGQALQQSLSEQSTAAEYRLSEEDIQYVLSQAREAKRIRVKDPATAEEYDDVFVNETLDDEESGSNICQQEGESFTPSVAILQTAQRLAESEMGALLSAAVSAYVDLSEYFGQELFHMEAPVGSSEPVEEPHGEKLVQLSEEWSAQLNGALAARSRTPCANSPEFLLFCMKKTTCLLEHAVEQDPHLLTPGRMATYLEVAKEVQDHYEEFAIQAKLGLPHIPELCAEEEASLEFPGNALLQLKSESQAASDERLSRAVAVVTHTHRASMRTVQALSDHSKLHLLEASFFTRTWKKACELIGCRTTSFVDIMDASAGHTAELVEVKASWHAVRTHHLAFMQWRTAVWGAMNASSAFHENFSHFIYQPGRTKGAKRTDPIYKEAGDVMSTALALKRNDDNGENIKKSSWWCLSFRASATGAYGKKFPSPTAQWGVVTGFKLITGSTANLLKLLQGQSPVSSLSISVGLTIGFVPNMPGVGGVRAGVSVGGTVSISRTSNAFSISLGLGFSAATGHVHHVFCGGPPTIGPFACGGSVAAAFTIFCKEFNFLNGDNGAPIDDPCATNNKVYRQNHRRRRRHRYDMPGQGLTTEETAQHCRERCNQVSGCAHYTFWPHNGHCRMQDRDSRAEGARRRARSGPPTCCAVSGAKYVENHRRRRRNKEDMPGTRKRKVDAYEDCKNRCKSTSGCSHFTFWPSRNCRLTSRDASTRQVTGRRRPVASPRDCSA